MGWGFVHIFFHKSSPSLAKKTSRGYLCIFKFLQINKPVPLTWPAAACHIKGLLLLGVLKQAGVPSRRFFTLEGVGIV